MSLKLLIGTMIIIGVAAPPVWRVLVKFVSPHQVQEVLLIERETVLGSLPDAYRSHGYFSVSPLRNSISYVENPGNPDSKERIIRDGVTGKLYDGVSAPVYSPDGNHLVYVAQDQGKMFVVVDDHEGPRYDSIVQPWIALGLSKHITFSNDGSTITFPASINGKEKTVTQLLPHSGKKITGTKLVYPPSHVFSYPLFGQQVDRSFIPDASRCMENSDGITACLLLDNSVTLYSKERHTLGKVGDTMSLFAYAQDFDSSAIFRMPFTFSPDGSYVVFGLYSYPHFFSPERKFRFYAIRSTDANILFKSDSYDWVGNPAFDDNGDHFAFVAAEKNSDEIHAEQFVVTMNARGPSFSYIHDIGFTKEGQYLSVVGEKADSTVIEVLLSIEDFTQVPTSNGS